MLDCHFTLNNKPISSFIAGAASYNAFSGIDPHINRAEATCIAGKGPIPKGSYYIIDRQSGGLLGGIREMINGKSNWFALYAIDWKIDDKTFCQKVERGEFRLHPSGRLGISRGCITINKQKDFMTLRSRLKSATTQTIPGTDFIAYGKVHVV